MAISSAQVSVTTSATLLSGGDGDGTAGHAVLVVNDSGSTVHLGPEGVTTSMGRLLTGRHASFTLGPGEALYGIVAASTATVDVFRTGV